MSKVIKSKVIKPKANKVVKAKCGETVSLKKAIKISPAEPKVIKEVHSHVVKPGDIVHFEEFQPERLIVFGLRVLVHAIGELHDLQKNTKKK